MHDAADHRKHEVKLQDLGLIHALEKAESTSSLTSSASQRRRRRRLPVDESHGATCSLDTYDDAKKCIEKVCATAAALADKSAKIRSSEARALAGRLGVPQADRLRKPDVCPAIELQATAVFASRDFLKGTEQIDEALRALRDASALVAPEKQVQYATALLDVTRFLNSQYATMFRLVAPSSTLTPEKRNKRLLEASSETLKQATNILRGVYGSFIDASVLRQGSEFPPKSAPQPPAATQSKRMLFRRAKK